MKANLKKHAALLAGAVLLANTQLAQADDQQTIIELQKRIEQLEQSMNERLNAMADSMDSAQQSSGAAKKMHIGGYGEMHYNHLDVDGTDTRQIDLHRMVLFFGYDFSDRARFVSEFEVEHTLVSDGARGAVEIEQAYVELDLMSNMQFRSGVMLMPVGMINETHEPPTFYGVERPVIETTIIPTTWYSAGISITHQLDNGISYDLMISEGLKTDDPTYNSDADPFDLKSGKQKASFADAFDLAVTGRVVYRGSAGLELAAYAQYQPDLDQSAEISYADDATLLGAHVIYQLGDITTKALYARWDLGGDAADAAGKAVQDGGYVEVNYRLNEQWGFFARQSAWSQKDDMNASQSDAGVNYYPVEGIVFKADIQQQNEDAGNADGFNLGMGYMF
ncbi:porin [Thalassolituus sp. C2-1]|uniref:porin n=1 Tax=Venatorbacter sp. C2-1 TaxID=2597518 RepID=UPI0011901748|nr:porin [Thalassolituus sp. C2-1]TVV42749.1 hypothetical protein FOT50_14870 [Thalassolituus sp. C2-1]